jgi:hypothetical protein
MTTTTSQVSPTRASRLPAAVRTAVRELESEFTTGTDAAYAGALARLTTLTPDLSEPQRVALGVALTAARERGTAALFTAQVRAALTAGKVRFVRDLPGGVELVEIMGTSMGQLLVTLPAVLASDQPPAAALVAAARASVLEGVCPRCGGRLMAGVAEQLSVVHRGRCPINEAAIATARRRQVGPVTEPLPTPADKGELPAVPTC